jgi:hypothetical protein
MLTKTRVVLGALAAAAVVAGGATAAAAQASAPKPGHLTFDIQGTAMKFFSNTGPMGPPTKALVPGDRVIAAGRWFQDGKPVGHDDEVCTEAFGRDALCQDMLILWGQGDLHSSYDFRWPASGRLPASFDGVIDGGTGRFRAAHGWFHYQTLPNGHEQITVTISGEG